MTAPGARRNDAYALFPLQPDEVMTCDAMLAAEDARLVVSPNHHINSFQDMSGFRFDCHPAAPGSCLPVTRSMFFGTTLVECQAREEKILQLMSNLALNKSQMQSFLQRTEDNCIPATLDCLPENASIVTASGKVQAQGLLSVDSQHWTPEVPERIGIYHAYNRGFGRDTRVHRLFIACTGGLYRASDAFANLIVDVGRHWTAGEVCESEETWFLRKASQRARCRLVKQLADAFGLTVNFIQDIQAYNPVSMAIPTCETLEHDISKLADGRIAVYNLCADTTRHMNGLVCSMHPSEGLWLFRGSPRGPCYGSMFGNHRVCGMFPTSAPRVKRPQSVLVQDSDCIVRLHSKPEREHYMFHDEQYFRNLERMEWNRDFGYIELIPIVVGLP
jgi:hypothetical protein